MSVIGDSRDLMCKICEALKIDKERPIRRVVIDLQVDCAPRVIVEEFVKTECEQKFSDKLLESVVGEEWEIEGEK